MLQPWHSRHRQQNRRPLRIPIPRMVSPRPVQPLPQQRPLQQPRLPPNQPQQHLQSEDTHEGVAVHLAEVAGLTYQAQMEVGMTLITCTCLNRIEVQLRLEAVVDTRRDCPGPHRLIVPTHKSHRSRHWSEALHPVPQDLNEDVMTKVPWIGSWCPSTSPKCSLYTPPRIIHTAPPARYRGANWALLNLNWQNGYTTFALILFSFTLQPSLRLSESWSDAARRSVLASSVLSPTAANVI